MTKKNAAMYTILFAVLYFSFTEAIELNISSIDSIRSVASTLAYDMMAIYQGNLTGQTPGILPFPGYYWWESGGMWGTLIDYWFYTNDSTYNQLVEQGLLFQTGPNWDYMPPNQTLGMGNDDQGFWAMAAMTAAESKFPNPPSTGPQWLGLAQSVFDQYVTRYQKERDPTTCGGGLRWQVYLFNDGWMYKNSISNACMFNLSTRLARYTANESYSVWAEELWNWVLEVGLMELQAYGEESKNFSIDGRGAGGYVLWDGATVQSNCTGINGIPYSYNNGLFLLGAATMYNHTNGSAIWANRTQLLLNATLNIYFRNGIAVEPSCEPNMSCNVDMLSFKAYLARSLAATTQLAPFTKAQIMPMLATSAEAAALQCSGGENGRMCGLSWRNGSKWDGSQGAGQQMAALEIVLSNMIDVVKPPLTNSTGGVSLGNVTRPADPVLVRLLAPLNVRDEIGGAFLTMFLVLVMGTLFIWMCFPFGEPRYVEMENQTASSGGSPGQALEKELCESEIISIPMSPSSEA